MGSKRLKAVVIRGDRHPPVADPDRCRAITESYAARMMDNPLTRWQLDPPGFSAWIHTHGTDAALCTHNYRDSVFPAADAYIPERFMERYRGVAPCPGCPNNCIKIFGSARHGAQGGHSGGIHQEITGAFGSNLGIADLDDVFAANILCNELGLDPNSLGFTLSMAMECVQEGVLDEAVVGEDFAVWQWRGGAGDDQANRGEGRVRERPGRRGEARGGTDRRRGGAVRTPRQRGGDGPLRTKDADEPRAWLCDSSHWTAL